MFEQDKIINVNTEYVDQELNTPKPRTLDNKNKTESNSSDKRKPRFVHKLEYKNEYSDQQSKTNGSVGASGSPKTSVIIKSRYKTVGEYQ